MAQGRPSVLFLSAPPCLVGGHTRALTKISRRDRWVCSASGERPSSGGRPAPFRGSVKSVHWHDAPMRKLTSDVLSISPSLSAILEIRDARLPRTCTHTLFRKWRSLNRVHYLVLYTHEDSIAPEDRSRLVSWTVDSLRIPPENVFIEDLRGHKTKPPSSLSHVTSRLRELCLSDGVPSRGQTRKVLVAGIPNVGKSSFVFTVTKEMTKKKKKKQLYHAPNVRDYAGETQNIKSHWLFENPNIMLTDTPGLFPGADQLEQDPESVYKLAVCGGLNLVDTSTTPLGLKHREVAQFLLYKLNVAEKYEYVKYYKMDGPTEEIDDLLDRVQDITGNSEKERCVSFIRTFNMGLLGEIILDDIDTVDDSQAPYTGPEEDDLYSTNLLQRRGNNSPMVENDDGISSTTELPTEPVRVNDALGMAWPGAGPANAESIEELLGTEFKAFEKKGGPRIDVDGRGYGVYGSRRRPREWRPPPDDTEEQRVNDFQSNATRQDRGRDGRGREARSEVREPFRRKRGPQRFDERRSGDFRGDADEPPEYQEGDGDFRRLRGQEAWERAPRREPPREPRRAERDDFPGGQRREMDPRRDSRDRRSRSGDEPGNYYDSPRRRFTDNRNKDEEWKRDAYVWNENRIPSVRPDQIPREDFGDRRPRRASRPRNEDEWFMGGRDEQGSGPRRRRRPPPPPLDELEYHFDDTDF